MLKDSDAALLSGGVGPGGGDEVEPAARYSMWEVERYM
jgi:hypothetical protein